MAMRYCCLYVMRCGRLFLQSHETGAFSLNMKSALLKLSLCSCCAGLLLSRCPSFHMNSALPDAATWSQMNAVQRVASLQERRRAGLSTRLAEQGLSLGMPIFLRIFKEELQLELWLQPAPQAQWVRHHTWRIAAMSGTLGPKEREGDRQAPEGIYSVAARQMNPMSSYHLSFNLGYPNEVDRALGRTGSFIMVHGAEVSVGCFAMTDEVIEDIYLLAEEALQAGQQSIAVHCFPFRMTEQRMATELASPWYAFWLELQPIYARFQQSQQLPEVMLQDGHYLLAQ